MGRARKGCRSRVDPEIAAPQRDGSRRSPSHERHRPPRPKRSRSARSRFRPPAPSISPRRRAISRPRAFRRSFSTSNPASPSRSPRSRAMSISARPAISAGFYSLAGQGALRIIAAAAETCRTSNRGCSSCRITAYDGGFKSLKDFPGHSVALSQSDRARNTRWACIADKYGFAIAVRILPLQSIANAVTAVAGGRADTTLISATAELAAVKGGMRESSPRSATRHPINSAWSSPPPRRRMTAPIRSSGSCAPIARARATITMPSPAPTASARTGRRRRRSSTSSPNTSAVPRDQLARGLLYRRRCAARRRRRAAPGRLVQIAEAAQARDRCGAADRPALRPAAPAALTIPTASAGRRNFLPRWWRAGARARDVIDLGELTAPVERIVVLETVEKLGHPPREALHLPDPAQADPE